MKKTILVILILGLLVSPIFSQNSALRVGLWVVVENEAFSRRVENEFTKTLESNNEWDIDVVLEDWNTDVHVILSGMLSPTTEPLFVWSITFTPIFNPVFTNGTVATSEANTNGMNWLARTASQYVMDQLFFMYDSMMGEEEAPQEPQT